MSQKSNKKLKLIGGLLLIFELGLIIGGGSMIGFFAADRPFSLTDFFINTFDRAKFNGVVYSNFDDKAVMDMVDFCEPFKGKEQVECVVAQMQAIYNYNDSNHTINSPTEYLNKGGVCRDSTIFYKAVFDNLGWYCQYIFPNQHHVYLLVSSRSTYCSIDGRTYDCRVK